jgi:two-component system chemotaxis response regulator CheY
MTRCLVIDDSKIIRKLAVRMLKVLNIETCEAEDGAEGFDVCLREKPDVVLVDWNMPVLDGLGFLKRLRASDHAPQPKVLMCTTETELSKMMDAMAAGADEYIMKPFDEEILSSKLALIGVQ